VTPVNETVSLTEMTTLRPIDLNELPKFSAWPARLLGLAPWTRPSRTIEKIEEEYDKDKYARCLDYFISAGENITPEEIRQYEFGIGPDDTICISLGPKLYAITLTEARARYHRLFVDMMGVDLGKCKTVVELGAGYGFNLWMLSRHFPNCHYWGGGICKECL